MKHDRNRREKSLDPLDGDREIGFVPGRGIVKARGKFVTEKMLFFDDVDIVAGEWTVP